MTQALSCFVIGDVNIDHVSDLSEVSFGAKADFCINKAIHSGVGGNGVFFAEAASNSGFDSVALLCATGDDVNGTRARTYLSELEVDVRHIASMKQTGQVIVLYQPDDRRVLIADRGANQDLATIDLSDAQSWANNTDLVYVSGYTLLNEDERKVVECIARGAKRTGALVLTDAVPHDIWQHYSWNEYVSICNSAQFMVAEFSTIEHFLSDDVANITPSRAAAILLDDFEVCLFRLNAVSDYLISDRKGERTISIPYRSERASLRFTDKVIAHVARQYLDDRDKVFQSHDWINHLLQSLTEE